MLSSFTFATFQMTFMDPNHFNFSKIMTATQPLMKFSLSKVSVHRLRSHSEL